MRNLDHAQNPVELIYLALENNHKQNMKAYRKRKKLPNSDDANLKLILKYMNRFKDVMNSIIKNELQAEGKYPENFNSDTRLKLIFIKRLQEFDYEQAETILIALGWDKWNDALKMIRGIDDYYKKHTFKYWEDLYGAFILSGTFDDLIERHTYIQSEDLHASIANKDLEIIQAEGEIVQAQVEESNAKLKIVNAELKMAKLKKRHREKGIGVQ